MATFIARVNIVYNIIQIYLDGRSTALSCEETVDCENILTLN